MAETALLHEFGADHDESTMAEARALLAQATARIEELSGIDQARLVYLEQREQETHDNRETAEDLFHAANGALFIVTVNLGGITNGREVADPKWQSGFAS